MNKKFIIEIVLLKIYIKMSNELYFKCSKLEDFNKLKLKLIENNNSENKYNNLKLLFDDINDTSPLIDILQNDKNIIILTLNYKCFNKTLHKVIYSNTDLTPIGEILKKNETIECLNIIDQDIENIDPLGEALKVNKTLEELYLNDNYISDLTIFSEGLKVNKTLKNLDLSHNNLKDLTSFGEALGLNQGLTRLQLIGVKTETLNPLFEGLKSNNSIKYLDLRLNNSFSDKLLNIMLKQNKSIEYINLRESNCEDGDQIGDFLKYNNTLKTLDLSHTGLYNIDLFENIKYNTTLEELDLSNNLTDIIKFGVAFLNYNNTLKTLDLTIKRNKKIKDKEEQKMRFKDNRELLKLINKKIDQLNNI